MIKLNSFPNLLIINLLFAALIFFLVNFIVEITYEKLLVEGYISATIGYIPLFCFYYFMFKAKIRIQKENAK